MVATFGVISQDLFNYSFIDLILFRKLIFVIYFMGCGLVDSLLWREVGGR